MKIAIVGSAPSSASLAPFADPEWAIWGCSPGAVQFAQRVDAWFELHLWGQDWLTKDYRAFLAAMQGQVYMIEPVADVPTSVAYPVAAMVEKYGRYWFTSTPAWMLALAVEEQPEEIGIWGIDMASDSEYFAQKPGCWHFIEKAEEAGIKVTIPPQSDLRQPPPLYGVDETNPMMVKLLLRQGELRSRIAAADAAIEQATREKLYLAGAEEDLRYTMQTWVR